MSKDKSHSAVLSGKQVAEGDTQHEAIYLKSKNGQNETVCDLGNAGARNYGCLRMRNGQTQHSGDLGVGLE